MYRLYQANQNPPAPDEGDDEAVDPLPAPFYGEPYAENGIPFQVTVEPVGDEPSALGDGSAMAFNRDFEELWRALEQQAIRNGWRHIQPGQIEDVIHNMEEEEKEEREREEEEEEEEEDEATEFGINSIPPDIIDPGYGDIVVTNNHHHQSAAPVTPRNLHNRSSFESSSNNETPIHANSINPYHRSGTNETPIHANISHPNRWEGMNRQNSGWEQPSRPSFREARGNNNSRSASHPVALRQASQGTIPPPPTERPRSDDDPDAQPAPATRRWQSPPRAAAAAAASATTTDYAAAATAADYSVASSWQTPPASITEERAKFISAGIIKPSKSTNLGIDLKAARDGAIEIEHIASDGYLFVCGTPLCVGDRITGFKTSKAGYTCGHIGGMRLNEVVRFLKRASGRLTILAENPHGDPERIECMTSKPHPEFGTGIFFLSGSPGSKILQIHSVPANGLFANSLLHRGARVISINGVDCTELDACVATDIVKSAPRFVSIVAQSSSERSVVGYEVNPAAHLRSVPEADGSERRGIFRGRSKEGGSVEC